MSSYSTNCKICQRTLCVNTSPAAEEHLSQQQLGVFLAMLTCNRCIDFKNNTERVEELVKNICESIIWSRVDRSSETWNKMRTALLTLTRKYAELIARHRHYHSILWSEDFANLLMEKPDRWWKVLGLYRQQARDNEEDQFKRQVEIETVGQQ